MPHQFFLFCVFLPLNLIRRRAELPTSITPLLVVCCLVHSKKAVKPRVIESGNKSNPSSFFDSFLQFSRYSFVSGIIMLMNCGLLAFLFFLFSFCFITEFLSRMGNFYFTVLLASRARARWPLRPGSCSSDLQDECRYRDWSRADGQSSGLLWVPHMWAQFS